MHIMQSHHNINVARRIKDPSRREGFRMEHFFRVLVEDSYRAKDVAQELLVRFPQTEGFKITITEWTGSGRDVAVARFIRGKD